MSVHNDTTNKQDVINEKNVHNNGEKVDKAAVVIARAACTRKATEDASVRRPLKRFYVRFRMILNCVFLTNWVAVSYYLFAVSSKSRRITDDDTVRRGHESFIGQTD